MTHLCLRYKCFYNTLVLDGSDELKVYSAFPVSFVNNEQLINLVNVDWKKFTNTANQNGVRYPLRHEASLKFNLMSAMLILMTYNTSMMWLSLWHVHALRLPVAI